MCLLQHLVCTTGGPLSTSHSAFVFSSCSTTSCSFHTFLSLCMFFSWILFCSPSPLPILDSLSSPAPLLHQYFFRQLVFRWTPTSNIHFKEPKPSHVGRKSPWVLFAQHCHTLSLPDSIQPSIHPSPSKMLFVYHHWSILAPGCCIRISSPTSSHIWVWMRMPEWWWVLLVHFWFRREPVHGIADPRSQLLAVAYCSLTAWWHAGSRLTPLVHFLCKTNLKGFTFSQKEPHPSIHPSTHPIIPFAMAV